MLFLSEFDKENDVLDSLMTAFWKLYAMRPVNYFLATIEARGMKANFELAFIETEFEGIHRQIVNKSVNLIVFGTCPFLFAVYWVIYFIHPSP